MIELREQLIALLFVVLGMLIKPIWFADIGSNDEQIWVDATGAVV